MPRVVICLLLVTAACDHRESKPAPVEEPRRERPKPAPKPVPACDPASPTACVGDDVVECVASGTLGRTLQSCKGRCNQGACVDTCAVNGVELFYVVDAANNLRRFDPQKLPGDPFQLVGTLTCDPASSPFSMAVDRGGIAWVLYQTGKLYRVSILDAHCSGGVKPRGAPRTFGMGFASDGPKRTTEQLFVAGEDDARMLAQLDTTVQQPEWRPIAKIDAGQTRNPELTGTGEGKLFGYFAEPGGGFVQELDRTTGKAIGKRWSLDTKAKRIEAYAFAHWGGVFYVFATGDGNSAVHAIHRKTGAIELVREQLPFRITGAGVSTCAPELERDPDHK